MKKSNSLKVFLNGIIVENPILVMLLGMCPTIAITNKVSNALGMGLAVLFVLFFSNLIISLIRKLVPNEIRIPVYIVIIATLVTIVEMLLKAYFLPIYESLGAFVALIVVNCIILGRAEAFASQNNPGKSILDALGMSVGFTLALLVISFIREFFGAGTITIWDGISLDCTPLFEFLHIEPIYALSNSTVGGFLILGLLIGCVTAIRSAIENAKPKDEAEVAARKEAKAQAKANKLEIKAQAKEVALEKAAARKEAMEKEREESLEYRKSLPVNLTRRGNKNESRLRSSKVRKFNTVKNYNSVIREEGGNLDA